MVELLKEVEENDTTDSDSETHDTTLENTVDLKHLNLTCTTQDVDDGIDQVS